MKVLFNKTHVIIFIASVLTAVSCSPNIKRQTAQNNSIQKKGSQKQIHQKTVKENKKRAITRSQEELFYKKSISDFSIYDIISKRMTWDDFKTNVCRLDSIWQNFEKKSKTTFVWVITYDLKNRTDGDITVVINEDDGQLVDFWPDTTEPSL